jgi:Zn-dependent protease with chaperone function
MRPMVWTLAILGLVPLAEAQPKPKEEKVEGYLEYRQGDVLVVDGQRIRLGSATKYKGKDDAKAVATIPMGYEVKAKGTRQSDGSLLAIEVEAKKNGAALFEGEVKSMTDQAEAEFRKAGSFFQALGDGKTQTIGRMYDSGPQVERARRIVNGLLPPYLDPNQVRVYVIENKEWNAFAMGNYSIYVFSGIMDDLDDDELSIVLGHEIAHASHEHTRRQFKKQMWIQIAALGVAAAAEDIDDKNKRAVVQLLTVFGASAWKSGYGRDLEDQADRVGLRYAYEGGYDITKGPRLWQRFAKKYGEGNKVANFFFSDHSLSSARAVNLERQIALNYPEGPKEGVTRASVARSAPSTSRPAPAAMPPVQPSQGSTRALAPAAGDSSGRKEIKPGMSAAEVKALFGKPKRRSSSAARAAGPIPASRSSSRAARCPR